LFWPSTNRNRKRLGPGPNSLLTMIGTTEDGLPEPTTSVEPDGRALAPEPLQPSTASATRPTARTRRGFTVEAYPASLNGAFAGVGRRRLAPADESQGVRAIDLLEDLGWQAESVDLPTPLARWPIDVVIE
jgi:hypothetical protein